MNPFKKQFFNPQGSNKFPQEMLEFLNQNTITGINISYDPVQAGIIYDISYHEQRTFAETLNLLAQLSNERNERKGFNDDDKFMKEIYEQLKDDWEEGLPNKELAEKNAEKFLKIWTLNRKLAMIALMHSELSEAVEGIRKGINDDKLPHRKGEEVEIADCLERIFHYFGSWGHDFQAHTEKTAYNETRPYKHGKQV